MIEDGHPNRPGVQRRGLELQKQLGGKHVFLGKKRNRQIACGWGVSQPARNDEHPGNFENEVLYLKSLRWERGVLEEVYVIG